MNRLIGITLYSLISLAFLFSPARADPESGRQWGMGMEVQSFGFNIAQIGSDEFFGIHTTAATHSFLFSFRWSPKFFIEPGIGIHMNKYSEDHKLEGGQTLMDEISFRDINLGIAGLYVIHPEQFTSSFLHFGCNIHLLDGKVSEQYIDYADGGVVTAEGEISSTAVSLSGGIGGVMTIKESVFLTVEGRLLYSYMGDVSESLSGPGSEFFTDDTDTKTWALDTHMVVGFRILM